MRSRSLPATLWHYTDAAGLFGIVTTRQLWFHDARFLNDRTERTYGEALLDRLFDEEIAGGHAAELTKEVREHVKVSRWPHRLFVCSFSETRESISQWQRYGADGAGYCLGFDRPQLDEIFDSADVSLESMIYDDQQQREVLREKIRAAVETYRQSDEERQGVGHRSVYEAIFASGDVDAARVRMKNPFFHDEHEWRYLLRVDDDDTDDSDEVFTVRGPYIKGHIARAQPPRRKSLPRLPLVRVVCGPKLSRDIAVPATELFLKSEGYEVEVEMSALADIWR